MKRKLAIALGVLLIVWGVSGCTVEGEETSPHNPDTHYTFVQELPDGDHVLCVWAKSGYGGGLSCDWSNRIPGGE